MKIVCHLNYICLENSAKSLLKSTVRSIQPILKENILINVPTIPSTESSGEVVLNPPGIKLRNKFNEIQLKLWDREEIYKYLCTLDHIESKLYKIKEYYEGKEIRVWMIAKGDAVDIIEEWIIGLDFFYDQIEIDIKWDVDANLFKEVLDWLHGLTFIFRFVIDTQYLANRNNTLNELLSLVLNGIGLTFYWEEIHFEFEWEINEIINDQDITYFDSLFKQIMLVDWIIHIDSFCWGSTDLWKIILNWMVVL